MDWDAVGNAVTTRMDELHLSQQELAAASGVSVATLREIQHGIARRRSATTLAALSRALQWPETHLKAVATGTLPSPQDTKVETRLNQVEADVGELKDEVAALRRTVEQNQAE